MIQPIHTSYDEVVRAMEDRCWDSAVQSVSAVLMRPILFHDLKLTFLEVAAAHHHSDGFIASHRHPWYEFNYLSHGALYTCMEDNEFLVKPGQVFMIPPGVMHSHRHYHHMGTYGLCIRWELTRIDRPESVDCSAIADDIMAAFSHYQPRCYDFSAEKLFEEAQGLSLYELEACFLQWFLRIYHLIHPEIAEMAGSGKDLRNDSTVRQVLLYLEEYSSQKIDVHELADIMGYSYRHLARLFKEKTGSTLIEKLNGIRIAKAIHLLENTDMPIGAISGEVGFHTETYFSSLFCEYTHLPPSVFRMRYQKSSLPPQNKIQ